MENDGGVRRFLLLLLFYGLINSLNAEKIFKSEGHKDSNKSKDLSSVETTDKNLKRMKDILNGMQIDNLFSTRSDSPSRRQSFAGTESSKKKKDCTESLMKDATNAVHARTDMLQQGGMPYSSPTDFPFLNPYFNDGQFRNEKFGHQNRESGLTNNLKSVQTVQPQHRTFQEDFNAHRPTLNPYVNLREISPHKPQSHDSFLNIGQSAHSVYPERKGNSPQAHLRQNPTEFRNAKEKHLENNPVANHFLGAAYGEHFDKQRFEKMRKDFPFFHIKPHQNIEERQVYGTGINNQQNVHQKRPLVPESRGAVHLRMPSDAARNFDPFINLPHAIEGTKNFFPQDSTKFAQLKSPGKFPLGSSFRSNPQSTIKPVFRNGDIRPHDPLIKPRFGQNVDSYDGPKQNSRQSEEDTGGNYPKSEDGSAEDFRGFSMTPSGGGQQVSRSVSYSQSSYGKNGKNLPPPTPYPNSQPVQNYAVSSQQPYPQHSEEDRDPTPPLHQSPKSHAQRGTPYHQENMKPNNVDSKYYNKHNNLHDSPQGNSFGGPPNNIHNAPQGSSFGGPHSNLHNGPQSSPHSVPHGNPQSGPHRNPQSGPHRNPQSGPYNNPFNGPHNSQLSGPHNGPLSGPHNGPLSDLNNGPLNGPHNGPLNGPHNGPLNGPHNGPLRGPHNGPLSNNHGTPYSNPISGQHSSQHGGPYANSHDGPYTSSHNGPYGNSHGGPYMGSHGSPHSGEQPNYPPHKGYGDSQYHGGYPDDSQYHSQPVKIDKGFFSKYGISNKAKIIVAEEQPNQDGKLEFVADGEKGIKPGDPTHPNPDYDSYRSTQNAKSGRHSRHRRPHRGRGRHSKKHRERMHRESTTQVNDHFHRGPTHFNEHSLEQNYKNHANKQPQGDSSRFIEQSSEQNHHNHFNKQQPGDFSRYNEHSSEQSYQNNAFRPEQGDSLLFNENSAEKFQSDEFKPQQTKELVQDHGNGVSRVVYSVPSAKKLSKLF